MHDIALKSLDCYLHDLLNSATCFLNFVIIARPPSALQAIPSVRHVENIGEMAFAAILSVVHSRHENTSTTLDKIRMQFRMLRNEVLPCPWDILFSAARCSHLHPPCNT